MLKKLVLYRSYALWVRCFITVYDNAEWLTCLSSLFCSCAGQGAAAQHIRWCHPVGSVAGPAERLTCLGRRLHLPGCQLGGQGPQ